jgi:DNA-binding NarL/FixJ family response regulator
MRDAGRLGSMLQIALLDDHPAILAGLRRLIEPASDLHVLAAAPHAVELARQLAGRRPDVLVLDFDLSRGDGLAHCRRVKNRPQPPQVIIYSAYTGPGLVLAARAAQADAVVDKAEPVHALLDAIRRVASGTTRLPVVTHDAYEAAVARLDDEDLPVFAMLLDREPVEAIADALRVDRNEVVWRANRIVGRLRPRMGQLSAKPTVAASRPGLGPPGRR